MELMPGDTGFNRTFMELKLQKFLEISQSHDCFNRTFMELKCVSESVKAESKPVLIVPLWNWNSRKQLVKAISRRFNRTFMELKWEKNMAQRKSEQF